MALTGVVLAGGASTRMGRAKARLELPSHGGRSLVEVAAGKLAGVVAEVVVADGGRGFAGPLRSVSDGAGAGPVAGLLGAFAARPGDDLLVLACDLPEVPIELLEALVELAVRTPETAWWMPRWEGGLEPLAAFYRSRVEPVLARRVEAGRLSLHGLSAAESGEPGGFLEGAALAACGDPATIFRNLNTPADLAAYSESGLGDPSPDGSISRRKSKR